MDTILAGKWLEGVAPADGVGAAAALALKGRLGAVLHYLPLASERSGEDAEHVHQLRVCTRRAAAAMRLFRDWLPRRRYRRMRRQLRRIRRAADEARNCDVLIGRLKGGQPSSRAERWLRATRRERADAQRAVAAVHHRLRRGRRLARKIDALLRRVRYRGGGEGPGAAARFGPWAAGRLLAVARRFFDSVPADRADEAALHRLRIRGKELRYAVELLAGAFPAALRADLYPAVEAIQDHLGRVNDLATACANLRQKLEAALGEEEASWRLLLRDEQAQFDLARREFWQRYPPPVLGRLRGRFEALCGGPAPEVPAA